MFRNSSRASGNIVIVQVVSEKRHREREEVKPIVDKAPTELRTTVGILREELIRRTTLEVATSCLAGGDLQGLRKQPPRRLSTPLTPSAWQETTAAPRHFIPSQCRRWVISGNAQKVEMISGLPR